MNGYPAEEVRKIPRGYRYAAAKDSAREFVESCPPHAVLVASELFEKQSRGSFRDLPLLFHHELEEGLAAELSREVYSLATDAIMQTSELIEAMLERAVFGAFNEAIEGPAPGFKHIDPSLASQVLPPPLDPIGRCPADEISPKHSAAANDEAKEFVESEATNALCIAVELFKEQSENSFADLPPLFHQELKEALRERLSREVYSRAADAILQTLQLLNFLLERAAVDAFDEARQAFDLIEPCWAGLLSPRR
jgi:hypothetical protein